MVIPFQPAPDVIHHVYYPPDVYLRYTFIVTIPGNKDSSAPSTSTLTDIPKHQENFQVEESNSQHLNEDAITVKGYKPWKERSQLSQETREQSLPPSFRKRVWLSFPLHFVVGRSSVGRG